MQGKESGMIELTEEQRRLVAEHAGEPVEFLDPVTRRKYVLVATELQQTPGRPCASAAVQSADLTVPPGIRRSQEAFHRDLPRLLESRKLRGQWVAYHGDERVGVTPRMADLTRECLRRGLQDDQFYVGLIDPIELVE